ncbi:hypothetical protein, partial [Sandarakinorhabdus glacialis]|uniref:hypothetical protein n=1 Tax=Sandarakinorhabdus glacialis TaxID=1614636 RepID=UPI001A9C5C8E
MASIQAVGLSPAIYKVIIRHTDQVSSGIGRHVSEYAYGEGRLAWFDGCREVAPVQALVFALMLATVRWV